MCGRFVNVRTEYRGVLKLPKGGSCSPRELEAVYSDIDGTERARLSREVLKVIPGHRRSEFFDWVKRKCSAPDSTPKPGPADPGMVELFMFYLLGHRASSCKKSVHDVAREIISTPSAADEIWKAA